MKLRHRVLRLLGIVSPSGAYPLPPRWAMSKLGRSRWYPDDRRALEPAYAAGGRTGEPVVPGALTAFSTGDPQHVHGMTSAVPCGPDSGYQVDCFTQQPYTPVADRTDGHKGSLERCVACELYYRPTVAEPGCC